MNFSQEIRERRVLPAVGFYIGACWVVVEILDRLVERYFLSPYLTDIVFWGLYSLLPAVVILAWTHGRPGKDRVTRAEKVGVPLNVLATIGLLLVVFGSKDLSATADLVTVDNELGNQEQFYVPRDSYRRRLALFFWDNESGDPALDWLQYGMTELLEQDLQQNPFILATSPWDNMTYGFYHRMKQAGYEDGLGLPLNLKREIADEANRDYFVDGSIARNDGEYRLTARVWDTTSLELLAETEARGWDVLTLTDRLSGEIRDRLDTPKGKSDLPLAETYGESEQALQAYIAGRNAVLFENDREKSNTFYARAIEADSGFVLAWFMTAINQWEQGDASGAQQALAEVQRLAYRLPERDQVTVKSLRYRMAGEQEKLEKYLRLQTQIQGDAASFRRLAGFLMFTGELEASKEAYRQAMDRDSLDLASYLNLATLERSTGNINAALEYANRFNEAEPDDPDGLQLIGSLHLEAGDMEAARDAWEQAQLIEEPPINSTLQLALLAMRRAEWSRASELIGEARNAASSAMHAILILQAEGVIEFRRGRIENAIELAESQVEFNRQVLPPLQQILAFNIPVVGYNILLNRLDVAEEILAGAMHALQPPLNQFLSFSEALLAAHLGDFDRAEIALEQGKAAIDRFKADYLAFQVSVVEAEMARARQDYALAAAKYQEAVDSVNRSPLVSIIQLEKSIMYGACAEMHVRAGELEQAQRVLDYAFERDEAEPTLWLARAMLQDAQGSHNMALASVNYALAIWADADPEYVEFQKALALRDSLPAGGQ